MKKVNWRLVIIVLAVIALIAALVLGYIVNGQTKTITSTTSSGGKYFIFQTGYVEDYLEFLENFDESRFEIVDISTCFGGTYSMEYYMVTYRMK